MEILTKGDKTLLKKSKRVAKIDDIVRNISASMVNAMIQNRGVGLSAPQVGILKRIITIVDGKNVMVMVNPEIIEYSKKTCDLDEGCLSLPDVFIKINRPEKIKVKYRSLDGHPRLEWYSGMTARIIQHEIDHLEGKLIQ